MSNYDYDSGTRGCTLSNVLLLILLISSIVVGIVIPLAIYAGIQYDYDHRYIPFTYDVDFLEVTSIVTFSPPSNTTSNQPDDTQFRLNFTVNTKKAKFFRTLQVTVEYDRHLVSNSTIAPFHQDALSGKTIPLQMGMADTRLSDKVIDSINTKLASEGVLNFTVIVRGEYWNVDYTDPCDMKMVCKDVPVTFSSTNNTWNGSTKDGPFHCKYNSKHC